MARDRVQGESVGSGLESFESILTWDDLRTLQEFYFISTKFKIKLVGLRERVDCPPSGYMSVYKEALKVDHQFFLHPFIVKLLNVYLLSLTQIVPNS